MKQGVKRTFRNTALLIKMQMQNRVSEHAISVFTKAFAALVLSRGIIRWELHGIPSLLHGTLKRGGA